MIGEVNARERRPPLTRDARVREREQRHDHVARPRVEELLQPLVGRDRRGQPDARGARELGRRLLAEEPEEVGRALEIDARGRRRERQQADREPGHDRIDARLEEREPQRRRRAPRSRSAARHAAACVLSSSAANSATATSSGDEREVLRVDGRRSRAARRRRRRPTTVSMNARRRSGNRGPTSASIPSANAVSVDIAAPQPCADGRPGVHGEEDQRPARPSRRARPASGRATRRRSRSSPMSNSRRASSPTTKKKNVISPLFTQ